VRAYDGRSFRRTEETPIPPGHSVGRFDADTVVRDEMVDFVKIEALKPGSNEYYDPVVAGNV
jgi:hypothetical protein